jgi:O-antigen biosynthesis protein WbqP
MSLVGPRPALHSQNDLVALRTAAGVERLRPGLTGWAQINGRDELPIPDKVRLDREYLERMSFAFDMRILGATARAALSGRGVSH